MEYKEVQKIAKDTIEYAKKNIYAGMSLIEIREMCERKMLELGADSFWYWNIGAFVFAGMKQRYLYLELNIKQVIELFLRMILLR